MSTRLVKGTAVVSLADGTKLGTVDRVYLDPAKKEIVAFSFHAGGLFGGRTAHLVDVADVRAIGPDAVTLCDASTVRSGVAIGARCEGLLDLEDLLKRKVITEGGAYVGEVAAIEFGQDTYRLNRIALVPAADGSGAPIPAEAVLRIGAEFIVVAEATGGATSGAVCEGAARPGLTRVA